MMRQTCDPAQKLRQPQRLRPSRTEVARPVLPAGSLRLLKGSDSLMLPSSFRGCLEPRICWRAP